MMDASSRENSMEQMASQPRLNPEGPNAPGLAIGPREVSKSFAATKAVDKVSFDVAQGSVHALLGENGAGKSTIVKLLSGLIEPDHGTISLFGDEVYLRSPRVAHRHAVQTAFQEMTLTPDLTVLDNM